MIEGNIKVSLHFGTIPSTACGGPPPLTKGRLEFYRKKISRTIPSSPMLRGGRGLPQETIERLFEYH